jgi:methionyl-tRNA formyltransferase
MQGETYTGVTTMQIDEGLDSGPILLQRQEAIGEEDTAVSLGMRLAEVGAELMSLTLELLAEGSLEPQPQDHSQATKAPLLSKEHGRIDWQLSAGDIYNRIRGLVPWPGAYTSFRGQLLHLWWGQPAGAPAGVDQPFPPGSLLVEKHLLTVACGRGTWLRVDEVQPASHKRLTATDFINGMHVKSGEQFKP